MRSEPARLMARASPEESSATVIEASMDTIARLAMAAIQAPSRSTTDGPPGPCRASAARVGLSLGWGTLRSP